MPRRPTKGTEALYAEMNSTLLAELRAFAAARGESVRQVLEAAVRRHMTYPPPLVEPLPDAAPKSAKPRRGGGGA